MLQPKFLLLALVCGTIGIASITAEDYSFLNRYHIFFSTNSIQVENELQQKREFNGLLIREFNREILLEFGGMIPRVRSSHMEFLGTINNHDTVGDECRENVLYLAKLLIEFQESDIQRCAYLTYQDLRADALNRFLPYEHEFARENTRATFQVVQTLGRNEVFDVDGLKAELQDELAYYLGLREFYRELLNEELDKHGDDAYVTINQLEECLSDAYLAQDEDHKYLSGYLDNNCGM